MKICAKFRTHAWRFIGSLLGTLVLNTNVMAQDVATQDPTVMATTAESYLREQLASLSDQASISMDPVRSDRLAACEAMTAFSSSSMKLRSRMTVGLRCSAPKTWTAYVQATVSVPGQYYVASRMIAPGQALSPQDLTAVDGDLVALPPGVITDPNTVLGMTAAHRINAGQPVKAAALRNAQSVIRGQNVKISARGKGFVVSSEGQAMENGAPGAMIQVRTASGQVVSGIVRNAGSVEVQL